MSTFTLSPGVSHEARCIALASREQDEALRGSATFATSRLDDELLKVWLVCQKPGWDGHLSHPVSRTTYRQASRLINALPLGSPLPSVGAEPDGALTLEWHHDRLRTLSVSVRGDGYLHYAGLFGLNRVYGTVAFFDEFPGEILTRMRRVYQR